ncbi:hypothetical protein [Tsukamurella pseudospumae]|nr:hypothetical protein [Tsukamurella pseudospumae]
MQHDQVVGGIGHVAVRAFDLFEERQELLMPIPRLRHRRFRI